MLTSMHVHEAIPLDTVYILYSPTCCTAAMAGMIGYRHDHYISLYTGMLIQCPHASLLNDPGS